MRPTTRTPRIRAIPLLAVTAALLAAPPAVAAQEPADAPDPETEAVRAAVLDYVEAVYDAEPERIERSVDEGLVKVGWFRARGQEAWQEAPMDFDGLVETARSWNAEGRDLSEAPKQITVFDVLDRVATAKLVAAWGIDYFHLAKDDEGRWRIVHVVWQSHTPETAAAARATAEGGDAGA